MVDLPPVVLLSRDVEPRTKAFYSDECNCACSGHTFSISSGDGDTIPNPCIKIDLSDAYAFMLNPWMSQGGAVLNVSAQRVWDELQGPHTQKVPQRESETSITSAVMRRMAEAGLLQELGRVSVAQQPLPRTLSVWLQMTNVCNLRCDYCYFPSQAGTMQPETAHAAVDAVMRSAHHNGFEAIKLKYAGGEPSLVIDQVLALHTYAQKKAFEVDLALDAVILSNGVALDKHKITELKSHDIRVMLSLDGLGHMHDAQRKFPDGRGSFAYVERALDALLAADMKPFISITVSHRNAPGLADVTRYVLARDLPFNFNFFRDNACAAGQPDLSLDDQHIIQALQAAFSVIEANLPDHSLLGGLMDRSQFAHAHAKTCGVGESYLVVDTQGNIAKCQMTIDQPVTTICADDPLADLRNDRSGLQNLSVDEKADCRDCQWRYWCAGGCPLLTYRTTGRYDVKSPYCEIYKAIYPELLRLEGLRIMKLAKVGPFA